MLKYNAVVQNIHGDVIIDSQVQVMLAGTNTSATVFLDAAGLQSITDIRTDRLGRFEFYIPNGRYDIYAVINGDRVAHETDVLMYDPEDDQRVTDGGGGSGSVGTAAAEVLIASTAQIELDKIDSTLGNMFTITLDADLVLPPVKNALPGERYAFNFVQDTTGGRKVTYNRKYRFPNNSVPQATTSPQAIDLMETDYIGAGFFLSRMFKGYSITPLVRIGTVRYDTLAAGVAALQTGQTLYVTRKGMLSEATAAMTGTGSYTVAGAPELATIPMLHTDSTIRTAFGKGILNIEYGDVIVRDLAFDGAHDEVDQTISGVRYNGGVTKLQMFRVVITNCDNGMLAGVTLAANIVPDGQYNIEMTDCTFDKNGIATLPSPGQSHNIYLNHSTRAKALRCNFTNAVYGHDFKTRADANLLDRCILQGAAGARELDVPNGGIVHAVNTTIRKQSGATQAQLIGIGQEGITDRPQEYIFRNCVLDNSQGANFGETWVYQDNSTIPVKFVDCVFIGPARACIVGPFELYYTGGPIGPEGWDQTVRGVIPKQGTYDSQGGNTFLADNLQPQPQTVTVDPTLTAFPATGSTATPTVRDDLSQAI